MITGPGLLCTASEGIRAAGDGAGFLLGRRELRDGPSGGGRRVLVLPGLLTGDITTWPMRDLLNARGYTAHGWGLGANIGPTQRIISGLDSLIDDLTDGGTRPLTVIGWSLGGLLGRDLACRHPDLVRRLITLGSPLTLAHRRQAPISAVYNLLGSRHLADYAFESWRHQRVPQSVPATSIYSRTDGIVHWHSCLLSPGPLHENVEVSGAHNGLGFNTAALRVVLDRLDGDAYRQEWRVAGIG